MKNDRVKLAAWLGDYTDGYVDIPWPLVHDQAGADVISWINSRDHVKCQMILEKLPDGASQELWAEFYDPKLYTEFVLRFAK